MGIRKVTVDDDFEILASLQRIAHATVAAEFGLTRENCPGHNSFQSAEELFNALNDYREFYCYEQDDMFIGFIGLEKSLKVEGTYYIEKVATHPDYRHQGIGREMMDFVLRRILELGGNMASVGLIDANLRLKNWYATQGFKQTGTKSFDHLPFRVCFMQKNLV